MSFRDDLLGVLSGGLPALIDGPIAGPVETSTPIGTAEGSPITPRRTEEIAPTGTFRDREPFLLNVTQNQILLTTAGIIGAIALVMVVRR